MRHPPPAARPPPAGLTNVRSLADDGGGDVAPSSSAQPLAGSTFGSLVDYSAGDGSFQWEQLRLIRAFDGGAEELTFIAIHAQIESHTPALLRAYKRVLRGLGAGAAPAVLAGLARLRAVLEDVVVSQLQMFNASDPHNYVKYVRPWIFGWKNSEDPELANGVVFEGVSDAPTFLRGETGAQSSIVPSLDVFLGITHKADALRAYLVDLEEYRPLPHRQCLHELRVMMWGRDAGHFDGHADFDRHRLAGHRGGRDVGRRHRHWLLGVEPVEQPFTR